MTADGRQDGCPLCAGEGETVLWADNRCRVILAKDADYPGTCRVIWREHVTEMTDLRAAQRRHLLDVVIAVERALRALMSPVKVNLASLGNQVPHLHWHVIPRFRNDAHYPDTVWSARRRQGRPRRPDTALLSRAIRQRLARRPTANKMA